MADPLGDGARVVLVFRIDAQGPAVGRQFLGVEQGQAVSREYLAHDMEREVAEMLVVDGVELVLRHEPAQMRELHGRRAARFQEAPNPFHEVARVGRVRQHVIADDEVRGGPLPAQRIGQARAPERDQRLDALGSRRLRDVARGLDAQAGNAPFREVVQEVPVIRSDLDHEAVRAETEPFRNHFHVIARVRQPRRRV